VRRRWLFGLLVAVSLSALPACGAVQSNSRPICRYGSPVVLMAQSVPGATLVPCVRALPAGWHFAGFLARRGESQFWLASETLGRHALQVLLAATCSTRGARSTKSDEPGTRRLDVGPSGRASDWLYRFTGGCVTYHFAFSGRPPPAAYRQIAHGVSFLPRRVIAAGYRRRVGPTLDPVATPATRGVGS
jgi:hypothetical protein